MKRRKFITNTGILAMLIGSTQLLKGCSNESTCNLKSGEVLHTVIFDLKHAVGSVEAEKFLTDAYNILTKVPGVQKFQVFRQCSPKNDYTYGFHMTFADKKTFDSYTAHPDHDRFVKERWDTEVIRFQESDFVTM